MRLIMKLENWIRDNEENFVHDVSDLVCIRSVSRLGGGPGSPFGEGCRKALDRFLAISKRDNFETEDFSGYCGISEAGAGKFVLGVWNHLDVVPEGSGWSGDPYTCRMLRRYLIGRGVQDNKGPAIAVHYAMLYCKEEKLLHYIRVKQIAGCSEENGMHDLRFCSSHMKLPDYSLVADCGFPVCCGEKGKLRLVLIFHGYFPHIIELHAGEAANIIPGKAYSVVCDDKGNTYRVEADGIEGHAAFPENTKNSIDVLIGKLLSQEECAVFFTFKEMALLQVLRKFTADGFGTHAGIADKNGVFGRLTCGVGILRGNHNEVRAELDIRYPDEENVRKTEAEIRNLVNQVDGEVILLHHTPVHYVNPNTPMISWLMQVYKKVTGDADMPYVMGGGTYAAGLENAVGFGAGMKRNFGKLHLLPGHGECHQADEAESLDNLELAIQIYVEAFCMIDRMIGQGNHPQIT